MKPGPTGTFPRGKLKEDDEGALNVAITHDSNQTVIVDFGKPIRWFGLPKEDAVKFAKLILSHAGVTQ